MLSVRARLFRSILWVRSHLVDWGGSVESFRAMVRRSERHFRPPADVALRADTSGPVPGEWLIPPGAADRPVILYLHGGGWTLGWTNMHRRMVAHLARSAGVRAFAVDYRLAPEHPFPAALDDCLAAYRWLLASGTPAGDVVIAGDSAGGNLTAAVLLAVRDAGEPLPAAAVLIGSITNLEGTDPSFHTRRDVVLKPEFAEAMARHYAGGHDLRTPGLSPYFGDLRGLPPLLLQAGGDEILRSDAERFAAKARSEGVDVTLVVWPGLWHVWHLFAPTLPEAVRALDEIAAFVRRHAPSGGRAPSAHP